MKSADIDRCMGQTSPLVLQPATHVSRHMKAPVDHTMETGDQPIQVRCQEPLVHDLPSSNLGKLDDMIADLTIPIIGILGDMRTGVTREVPITLTMDTEEHADYIQILPTRF